MPCDWHLAVRSLIIPTNIVVREIWRRSQLKDGKMTVPLEDSQTAMVEDALASDAKYILFIEDDTIPPPGTLMELGRVLDTSDEDVMACGGIYTTRTEPPEPILYMGPGEGAHWNWRMGDIFPCWSIGMGCTMIKVELFKKMPKPWFKELKTVQEVRQFPELFEDIQDKPGTKVGVSTDLFFFTKLNKMGYKVLAHGGVLPIHWDIPKNQGYWLPKDTPPTRGVTFNGKPFGWTDPNLKVEEESLVAS